MSAPKKEFQKNWVKAKGFRILILPYHETIYKKRFDINRSE